MKSLTVKVGRKHLEQLERLIALETLGHTVSGSAQILCVSRETVYNWKKEPLYVAMKTRERNNCLVATTETMIGASLAAMRLLMDVANDFRIDPLDRVPAALAIMELASKQVGELARNLTFSKESHDPQLAEVLFPKVIEDRKPKQKKLPAPAPELKKTGE